MTNENPYDNEAENLDDVKFRELELIRRQTPLAFVGLFAAVLSFFFLLLTQTIPEIDGLNKGDLDVLTFFMSGCFGVIALICTVFAKRFLFWAFTSLICWSGYFLIFGITLWN